MESAARPRRIAKFGVFELDLRTHELRKFGSKVSIHGQPIQILILLTERPGELVTREELRQKLWPADTYVGFEQSLNAAVKRLRQALNDSANNPRFVETLPRRGYRFIVPVEIIDEALESGVGETGITSQQVIEEKAVEGSPKRSLGWKIPTLLLAVMLAGLAVWMLHPWRGASATIHSVAVLPLENLSGDVSQEYFSDGMTDELITELGQIRDLRVISRTSMMTYKGARTKSLPQIASELNVDAVVEGTVLRSENRVRITVQLIQAVGDKHLWAKSYEGDFRDTLTLQTQVARAIVEQVRTKLSPTDRTGLKEAQTVNPEAYEAFLKGRYFWNKRTGDGLQKAKDYFEQAIAKDPNYAQAYSGLADTYALLGDWQYAVMAPGEALPKAKTAAIKAIALDGSLGEAHTSLAFCLEGFDWDFELADREFRRAIELSPGYATAHHWYAWHLSLMGRHPEAIAEMKKAVSLDPLSLIINADLAEILLIAHFYDESVKQSIKTIDMDPNFAMAHNQLGQAYLQKGIYDSAIAELQKCVQLSDGSPICVANLARAYAMSGRRNDSMRLLDKLKNQPDRGNSNGSDIAAIYAALGDQDQAMVWLEKSYEARFNPGALLRPGLDPLRSGKPFQDLLRRIGLKP